MRSFSFSAAPCGIIAVFLSALLSGCSSQPTAAGAQPTESSDRQRSTTDSIPSEDPIVVYTRAIDRFSDGDADYSGFYNKFEYKATLHNSFIRTTLLSRQNDYYQWEREKFTLERDKSAQEMATQTTVFLSFYTPDRRNDNLSDVKSIWRIYLDAGGRRYEGKIKKLRQLFAELQTLYPYHTRWNTPYLVTFPVPTNAIETQNSVLTVTGPLGTRTVKFSAVH